MTAHLAVLEPIVSCMSDDHGNEDFDWDFANEEPDETTYAQGRQPESTYLSKSFMIDREGSQDLGFPARFIYKVFEDDEESRLELEGDDWVVYRTPAGRFQTKLLVCREGGNVKELWIQRVPGPGQNGHVRTLFTLRQPNVTRLVELLRQLDSIPIEGNTSVRMDDAMMRELLEQPGQLSAIYQRDPAAFRRLISNDASAADVVAIARRRLEVEMFERMLTDDGYFDSLVEASPGGPESVWQQFFQRNSWILGATLSSQVLTSWDETKLEQAVAGRSVSGAGKRTDALLRTSGLVSSMVFAEFKTHRTRLLGNEYRPDAWGPSVELTGGLAQVQATVHLAVQGIGDRLAGRARDGSEIPGDVTYLFQPRSYLIVGQLNELYGEREGPHHAKIRSFELFRRSVAAPEIVTYDEMLARTQWLVSSAD
jgi:hypothetical protein